VPRELRVLFVSKPIAPPWNDGSKNLVRDIASHLVRARPTVLTTPGAPSVGERVTQEPIYREGGGFAPGLVANARVLARLLRGDAMDAWHFVFAPNRASSSAARVAIAARRATGWKGRVVQTVASAPRDFREAPRLLFGDRIVVLSEWMRARLVGVGASARDIRVVPPCAAAPERASEEAIVALRARLALGDGPIVLYPGDYEVSTGAITVARATRPILNAVPRATVVFACRPKTKNAEAARRAVLAEHGAGEGRVVHVGEIPDLHALIAASSVVAFPVDDLYGKVDVPLVVLEAMALGVPLVLAGRGPLEMVAAARFVEPAEPEALAREIIDLLTHVHAARDLGERARREHEARFSPRVVASEHDALYEELFLGKTP
jgi:glycosyltransferase involved in cell wall biosynthesis